MSAEPGTAIPYGRRRVRPKVMALELGISLRKFREIMTLGLPYTQVQGIVWVEPDKVHAWLDKFNRMGAPGIKGHRKLSIVKKTATP